MHVWNANGEEWTARFTTLRGPGRKFRVWQKSTASDRVQIQALPSHKVEFLSFFQHFALFKFVSIYPNRIPLKVDVLYLQQLRTIVKRISRSVKKRSTGIQWVGSAFKKIKLLVNLIAFNPDRWEEQNQHESGFETLPKVMDPAQNIGPGIRDLVE